MASKSSFGGQISAFERKALKRIDQVRRSSIVEMFGLVITATPVENGFLRGAWQTTINTPNLEAILRPDVTGSIAKAEILSNMGTLTDVVYFTNTMPYAYRIEYDSWSAQAKAGMLRSNLPRWNAIVAAKAKAFSE